MSQRRKDRKPRPASVGPQTPQPRVPRGGVAPVKAAPIFDRKAIGIALALIGICLLIYYPVRHYGFVALDDPQYVSENPHIAGGLTWDGVVWAFTSIYASYWLPLIWLSHMLDVQLYGLQAGGHHVTNLLLHIANSLLLFGLFRRMTGSVGRSAFVAALFAAHPLHVESVVWITERKDVLSTLFWILTMWAYVDYVRDPRKSRYFLVLTFFVLGLMSKSMLVTLPMVLLLMDFWPLRRIPANLKTLASQRPLILVLLREKIPMLILGAAASVITYLAQERTGAVAGSDLFPLGARLSNAMLSYVSYIAKTVWPVRLALFYPYPKSIPALEVLSCIAGLIGITICAIWIAERWPYVTVGWLWFVGTLVPVIGVIQAGQQAMADRFTYVPSIGLFLIVAWGIPDLLSRWAFARIVLPVAGVVTVAVFTIVAMSQVQVWKDPITLWEHALHVVEESHIAHMNLGIALVEKGNNQDAVTHFQSAIRIHPNYPEAHTDLGVALANQGRTDDAIREILEGLQAKPNEAAAHYNVAVLLSQKGETTKAVEHLETALRLSPGDPNIVRELQKLTGRSTGR